MADKQYFTLSLGLGYKPCVDLEIESQEVNDTDKIRAYGNSQHENLHEVADIIDKLKTKDWNATGLLYSIDCSKICTQSEAERDLTELGLAEEIEYLWARDLEEFE